MALWVMTNGNNKEGGQPSEQKAQPEQKEGVLRGSDITKGLRKGTKRARHAGDGPSGHDEPPKQKIYVKGDYMDFKEYLAHRLFLFVHHYSGETDNLSLAVKEECEKRGMKVDTVSIDAAQGYDLMAEVPFKYHFEHATLGKIDGFHAGFPCNTYSKLRWREAPGMPKPLRSKSHPYGLPGLSAREREQCDTGTILMARSALIVSEMDRADREMQVPSFATLENPPPTEHPEHLAAWHMPEMVDLVDSIPSWKCAHFNTCAYESNLEVGTRHYKPQMIGGTLPGIEDLCKRCPCGNRPHEPVVGKERSARSAAYPTEFCKAYATLAVNHFEKIAQAEFLEGRLKLLEDRIEHLRGKAYDFSQEAMDIEEYNKTVMESVEYKKGLEHKRKMAESKSPPGGESAAAGAGASASSGSSLVWKGGHGKHGALREPRNKEEVPKALVHVGGMRDPHKAVSKLPTVQSQGARLWSRWLTFAANNPKVTDVAESYGTERCAFNQDLVEKWKEHLCELWDIAVPGAKLVEKGKYATPVLHEILDAWIKKSGDPETEVPKWLASGTPLGIELPIKSVGIFPPAEEDDVGGPGDYVLSDAVLERPETMKNYKSVEEDVEGTNIELQRYEKHNFLKRISQDEAKKLYPDGTVSRLGLVTKQKEGGEVKRRVVIDLRRSGGNAKSKLPERLVLPRLTDAIKLFKDIRRRSNGLAEKSEVNVLEFALVDISDAFTVLPVAEEELKHTLTPSTVEGEVLVFQALLFGYKVAPLLYSRFAATVARLLQSAVRIEKGGHEVYLDDSLWALQGKLHDRNITLAFILNTMAALGLKVALHKGARSSSVVWIGVTLTLVDHNTLVVGLPGKFIQELQEILGKLGEQGLRSVQRAARSGRQMRMAGRHPSQSKMDYQHFLCRAHPDAKGRGRPP